jgi:hypothetical protein
MKIVLNLVPDMVSVIKENVSATRDGSVMIAEIKHAHPTVLETVSAITGNASVLKASRVKVVPILMYFIN